MSDNMLWCIWRNPKVFGDKMQLPSFVQSIRHPEYLYVCMSFLGYLGSCVAAWHVLHDGTILRISRSFGPLSISPIQTKAKVDHDMESLPLVPGESRKSRHIRILDAYDSEREDERMALELEIASDFSPQIDRTEMVSTGDFDTVKGLVAALGRGVFDPWGTGPHVRLLAKIDGREIDFSTAVQDDSSAGKVSLGAIRELLQTAGLSEPPVQTYPATYEAMRGQRRS